MRGAGEVEEREGEVIRCVGLAVGDDHVTMERLGGASRKSNGEKDSHKM